jgi:hypothetical protein
MGALTSEVGYTSAITKKGGPQSLYGHVVALDKTNPQHSKSHSYLMYWKELGENFTSQLVVCFKSIIGYTTTDIECYIGCTYKYI